MKLPSSSTKQHQHKIEKHGHPGAGTTGGVISS